MEEKSQLKLRLYQSYLEALSAIEPGDRFMPYAWVSLPDPISARWIAFSGMLEEFARELANAINDLTNNTRRLGAWAKVVKRLTDTEKLEASHEFISNLATHTVLMPYVIKSRFAFSVAHLCHQANFARDPKGWKDDFPLDGTIHLNTTDRFGSGWRRYNRFKRCVEDIHGKAFREGTRDFRHAYNHRFSPRFVIGMTNLVTREVDEKTSAVRYAIGGHGPLDLEEVVDCLVAEQKKCYGAFEAFQELVGEMIGAVEIFERASSEDEPS